MAGLQFDVGQRCRCITDTLEELRGPISQAPVQPCYLARPALHGLGCDEVLGMRNWSCFGSLSMEAGQPQRTSLCSGGPGRIIAGFENVVRRSSFHFFLKQAAQ